MSPVRPPRESYVRAVHPIGPDRELIAGLEIREGDHLGELRVRLRMMMEAAWGSAGYRPEGARDLLVARSVEELVTAAWPDRAYFVEACADDPDGWVQIFQPWHEHEKESK